MKHIRTYLLATCLLLVLTSCGDTLSGQNSAETEWTIQQMASAVWEAGTQLEGTEILPGDELYDAYLTTSYGLDAAQVTESTIWVAGGTSAQEVAVFQLSEDAPGEEIVETLHTYLENRTGAFTGYLPEEAARDAFDRCFSREPPEGTPPASQSGQSEQTTADVPQPTDTDKLTSPEVPTEVDEQPPDSPEDTSSANDMPETAPSDEIQSSAGNTKPESEVPSVPEQTEPTPEPEDPDSEASEQEEVPWSYSESRLLTAWAAGDWSGLATEDQAILDVCQDVISNVVPADGSDYDKELAVHDWMVSHGRYDSNTLSQLPDFQENPNNDNPYGFLVDGVGICLGYTQTFQLFMDLLGIECITVEGAAYNYTADHAWNQVRLDGAWYCVDVTWDDPTTSGTVSERSAHRFFNVTSDHMRSTNHQWDESSVPEAAGTAYAWY